MNIIDYTEAQMDRFEVTPFCPVDSLVLSQFAYVYFNDVISGFSDEVEPVCISELLKAENFPRMLGNVRDPKSNHKLLLSLGMSPRFRDIRMCFYIDSLDVTAEKQFAAVTCLLDDKTAYISYRGTDSTFVGWKEDFNMAFMSPVPAQKEGVDYLNAVAQRIPHQLMVGGHSKGGNIAVYSAMECEPAIGERIVIVYSHDGPGFREEIFASKGYANIKARIHKTLPESAIVGMLLQQQEDYFVVESKQFGPMQHDPFSWVIDNENFRYVQSLTSGAKYTDTVIKQWLSETDDEERELFITTLYSVIATIGVVNFSDLTDDWHKKAVSALDAVKGINGETKHFVLRTIKSLAALYLKNLRFPFKKSIDSKLR